MYIKRIQFVVGNVGSVGEYVKVGRRALDYVCQHSRAAEPGGRVQDPL